MQQTNHPNAGFSFWADIFEEIAIPIKIPAVEKRENINRKAQSIAAPEESSPANPTKAFAAITKSEVPTDILMGMRAKNTSAGMIKNPPPIPTMPVRMPVKKPIIKM